MRRCTLHFSQINHLGLKIWIKEFSSQQFAANPTWTTRANYSLLLLSIFKDQTAMPKCFPRCTVISPCNCHSAKKEYSKSRISPTGVKKIGNPAVFTEHSYNLPRWSVTVLAFLFILARTKKPLCRGETEKLRESVFWRCGRRFPTQAGACGRAPSAVGVTSLATAKFCGHLTLWHLCPAFTLGRAANERRESVHKPFFLRETNENPS